jgi:hypothetical protein
MNPGISEAQALSVSIGMSEAEVSTIAGWPEDISGFGSAGGLTLTWTYSVATPVGRTPGRLVVVFGNGRVCGLRREGGARFVFPK